MNSAQCRMARAGLDWTLQRLEAASGVKRRTIIRLEGGETVRPENVEALRAAFVSHGVEFINGGKRTGVAVRV